MNEDSPFREGMDMSQPLPSSDHPVSPDGPRRPQLLVFDVNETLSDMAPMADRFAEVGAAPLLARSWFAGVLRDGFALTVNGVNPSFAEVASASLRSVLGHEPLDRGVEEAVEHVMGGLGSLGLHPDVVPGVEALAGSGIRLVTLSNGSTSIARKLLDGAGIADRFERLLSVEQAGIWKPAPAAYGYALEACRVDPMDAMLVAAHPWDTDGAQRAGLASAWINRGGESFPAMFEPPSVEAASLTELAESLR
ncbi:MAG: haloacid dehalogenase type II [Actinomycetota bacterium]|nr:haloacid dehalogenase type II [Actinomycetota bacterium]